MTKLSKDDGAAGFGLCAFRWFGKQLIACGGVMHVPANGGSALEGAR